MGLKATRTILSILLCFVMAASILTALVSFVLSSTLAKPEALTKKLVTPQLVSECTEQLNMKYAVLEAKSGIPARVFATATKNSGVEFALTTAAENIFSQESPTLYSEEKVEYFYKLCTEYLDGNKISYKKKYVRQVSEEAARIFSDTVGIHGTELIEKYIASYRLGCSKVMGIAVFMVALCCLLMTFIYSKKVNMYFVIGCGIAGGGIATIMSALSGLIFKIGSGIVFYPSVYQASLYSIIKYGFGMLLLLGIACTAVAYAIVVYSYKIIKRDNTRQQVRYSKLIGKR